VVNAAGPEPTLRDLETAAIAQQHIGGRDPGIVEKNFGVAMRRLVIAKDRQHSFDDDAGMGQEIASVLYLEGLFRSFGNRRQLAAYAGLAPTPCCS
jgi:hypothetical protein